MGPIVQRRFARRGGTSRLRGVGDGGQKHAVPTKSKGAKNSARGTRHSTMACPPNACGSYRRCRQRRHARQLRGSRNTQNIGRPQVTEEVSGQETDKPGGGNTTILDRWRGATVQKEADAAFGYAIAETQASHAAIRDHGSGSGSRGGAIRSG